MYHVYMHSTHVLYASHSYCVICTCVFMWHTFSPMWYTSEEDFAQSPQTNSVHTLNFTLYHPSCAIYVALLWVIQFVLSSVLYLLPLFPGCWCFQLPVPQAMQEHLGEVVHGLPVLLCKVTELVEYKVGDALRKIPERKLHNQNKDNNWVRGCTENGVTKRTSERVCNTRLQQDDVCSNFDPSNCLNDSYWLIIVVQC